MITTILVPSSPFGGDFFHSPSLHVKSGHLLIEVDISPSETQVFLYDRCKRSLYLENSLWESEQIALVTKALRLLDGNSLGMFELFDRTILLGVWHFGHLIGDHAQHLIKYSKPAFAGGTYPLHKSANNLATDNIAKIFNTRFAIPSEGKRDDLIKGVRIYALSDCLCIFPSSNKSFPLATAHHFLHRAGVLTPTRYKPGNVFLTSGRAKRIANISCLSRFLANHSWIILNPLQTDPLFVLQAVANAKQLISENGSILFNCFLSRTAPYCVLASQRSTDIGARDWAGGGAYNSYHKDVINYLYCPSLESAHHPYSDQIEVSLDSLMRSLLHQ